MRAELTQVRAPDAPIDGVGGPSAARTVQVVQVIGVAPVGSTGVRSVTAQATDSNAAKPSSTTSSIALESRGAESQRLEAEAVVFPRERTRLDVRPEDLRRRRAAQRYAEDGGRPPG
jgi:hypothetical protein